MSVYGYARVSSLSQKTEVQEKLLKDAGCSVIRTEKVSGKSRQGRDELANLMDFIADGDQLVVCKLDRLGRSTRDVLNLVHELEEKKASLRVLEPEIDTSGPMGKMILTVLGMVGEMELNHLKERQNAGIEAAKAKGVYKGRPVSLDHERIRELSANGMNISTIATQMKCSRGAVYKILGSTSRSGPL